MKRIGLLMLLVLLVPVVLTANPVSKEEARQKALSFISKRRPAMARGAQLEQNLKVELSNENYHVFNLGRNDGFVIVSGDDSADNILGYADSGTFDAENMPENLKAWLEGYAEQIALLKTGGAEPTRSRSTTRGSSSWTKISPLLESKWNQGNPYNQQVPTWWNGTRCVTGCVATAMAQVMYYWYQKENFKAKLEKDTPQYTWYNGSQNTTLAALNATETFDWANMTNEYSSSSTTAQQNAVAELMHYCGRSVKMKYGRSGYGGSSATPSLIAPALTDNFGYKSAQFLHRHSYSYEDWQTVVYTDLAAGRPVLYGGGSRGGFHRFVCDGYDEGDYFHFNWGWGGKSDGYYKMELCNPKDQGIGGSSTPDGYRLLQTIVCCVHPTKTISLPIQPMTSGSSDNISVTSVFLPTLTELEDASILVTFQNRSKTESYQKSIIIYIGGTDGSNRVGGGIIQMDPNSNKSQQFPITVRANYTGNYTLYIYAEEYGVNDKLLHSEIVTINKAFPNLTGTVKIRNDKVEVGSVLTYSTSDTPSGKALIWSQRWQVSNDGTDRWEDISEATYPTYTPTMDDLGKYIRLVLKAADFHGTLISSPKLCEPPTLKGTVTYNNAQPSPSSPIAYVLSGKVKETEEEDASLIKAQWQYSDNGKDGWTNLAGKTGNPYWLKAEDVGKYFRVMIMATGFDGALYGPARQCVKWNCVKEVVTPEIEVSTAYNQIQVKNPQTMQEYLILNYKKDVKNLTESDWAAAKRFGPDDTFLFMGGTENSVNYVYTRVKETETMYAGTDVRMAKIYFGETVYLQEFSLTPRKAIKSGSSIITEKMEQGSDGYYVKLGDVIQIEVTPVPANATNFDGILGSKWINNSKDGDFFTNIECYIPVNSTSSYKKVYFKPKKQANNVEVIAEHTMGYNQIARDAFTLNVGDASGNYLIDHLGLAVDVNKHDALKDIELMNIHPVKASLDDVTIQLSSGTGTAPVVTLNKDEHTIDVDATDATKGYFNFDFYQGSRKIDGGLTVNVTTPPVEEMKVQPSELWLDCGESQQITAFIFPAEAEEEITWESSDESVATVSADGVVTMAANADIGATATITAKAGDKSATCKITVPGEKYDLYLAGTQVTTRNKDKLAELVAATSEASMEQFNTGKMEIDFDGTTLRLKDTVIDTGDKEAQGMTLGINGMTLMVEGNCIVKSKDYNGLKVANNATITGDGSLRLEGGHSGITFSNPSKDNIMTLTLDYAKVEALGSSLSIDGGLNPDYTNILKVNHSELTATGKIFFASGDILLDESYYVEPLEPYFRYNGDLMDGEQVATGLKILPYDKGDVNLDGKVNIADVVMTARYCRGENPAGFMFKAADINEDGKVDVKDVKLIVDIIMGTYVPPMPLQWSELH
ncbi:MAG: C10 family peptidase [Prevotella sp.]|nr:C10 family peptidase [Prevotella sp.]